MIQVQDRVVPIFQNNMASTMEKETQTAPSTISGLAPEMVTAVYDQLDEHKDRSNFAKTCRYMHQCSKLRRWGSMTIQFEKASILPPHCSRWCSSVVQSIQVDQWRARVKSLDQSTRPKYICKSHSINDAALCSACIRERTFGHADDLLVAHKDKLSKCAFALTFTGNFGEYNRYNDPSDPLFTDEQEFSDSHNTRGWDGVSIKSFQFNMYWKYWHTVILSSFSLDCLSILKIPFTNQPELEALVRALLAMTQLRSLAVTDIPDCPDLPDCLPILGQGIRARATSLRELDFEMTNCNKPNPYAPGWLMDDAYVKHKNLEWFFDKIFLDPEDLIEMGYSLPLTQPPAETLLTLTNGPILLKLEKLRLKNIDIPTYSSREIFDWTYLKELRLPNGRVDDAIWKDLHASKLEVLEDIDYILLTHPLIKLIQSQSTLKSVTFTRPRPLYQEAGSIDWGDGIPQMAYKTVSVPAPLGPGTEWGRNAAFGDELAPHAKPIAFLDKPEYPGVTALLVALGKNKGLENLVLPVDMYDITPAVIWMMSRHLKSVTHLTWGFDYANPDCRNAFKYTLLPAMHKIRRITFQSLCRPLDRYGKTLPDFHAKELYKHLNDSRVPSTLRYVRYRPLFPTGTTYVYYHRLEPVMYKWWIRFEDGEGNRMYEEDRTPMIHEAMGPERLGEDCGGAGRRGN